MFCRSLMLGVGVGLLWGCQQALESRPVPLIRDLPQSGESGEDGSYTLVLEENEGGWLVWVSKEGETGRAVSSLDASYILQATVGLRQLTLREQQVGDVSGNGTLSALDASLILQRTVGLIERFPVAQKCGSDWVGWPQNHSGIERPLALSSSTCMLPAVQVTGQGQQTLDWAVWVWGDVTGNGP